MDVSRTTSLYRHAQGLVTSLILSVLLTLCASTPIPPHAIQTVQPPHHDHYVRLVRDTQTLLNRHSALYASFKLERYSDSAIRIDDFTISGVPNVNTLPSALDRYSMTEDDLLPIHYDRLVIFEHIMAEAKKDEFQLSLAGEENFNNDMDTVLRLLQRVVSKLTQTMIHENIPRNSTDTTGITFSSNDSHSVLNMRILYVLQEINSHMVPILEDFVNLKARHDQLSS